MHTPVALSAYCTAMVSSKPCFRFAQTACRGFAPDTKTAASPQSDPPEGGLNKGRLRRFPPLRGGGRASPSSLRCAPVAESPPPGAAPPVATRRLPRLAWKRKGQPGGASGRWATRRVVHGLRVSAGERWATGEPAARPAVHTLAVWAGPLSTAGVSHPKRRRCARAGSPGPIRSRRSRCFGSWCLGFLLAL